MLGVKWHVIPKKEKPRSDDHFQLFHVGLNNVKDDCVSPSPHEKS